jgi:hypothetical protein
VQEAPLITHDRHPRHPLPQLLGGIFRYLKEAVEDRYERRELARQARRFADDLEANDDIVEARRTDFARLRYGRRP